MSTKYVIVIRSKVCAVVHVCVRRARKHVWVRTYVSRHALAIGHLLPATGTGRASAEPPPHETDTLARAEQHVSSSRIA